LINIAMDDTVKGSANAARPLNVNPDGSPLTYCTATHGADSADWLKAEHTEWDRLLETKTCHAIHLHQQPFYRILGTTGGDRINYDGPTKANTAPLSTVKIPLQSVVCSFPR
jgi:hypothetical protein